MDKSTISSQAGQIDQCCERIKSASSPEQIRAQVQEIKRCYEEIDRCC